MSSPERLYFCRAILIRHAKKHFGIWRCGIAHRALPEDWTLLGVHAPVHVGLKRLRVTAGHLASSRSAGHSTCTESSDLSLPLVQLRPKHPLPIWFSLQMEGALSIG